jgi:regulator of replication initiation timing
MASYDLTVFNSHIQRGVDTVLSVTRWTTRVLDDIAHSETPRRGAVNPSLKSKVFSFLMPLDNTDEWILDQYIRHTRVVEEEIQQLISEAQALLMILNNLEDRLDIIHGIVTRDDVHAQKSKEEVLAELWTMLGGNRGKLNKVDRQLNLLRQVGAYRKTAYAHVSGTILRLQEMGVGLEDLRERVAAPELLRDRAMIPLSVHLDSIQKGVERLEISRQGAKDAQSEELRKRLNGDGRDAKYIEG